MKRYHGLILGSAERNHVDKHVISGLGEREKTHIFLSLLDAGCDLSLGSECLVLGRVDLSLSEHRKRRFDTQLLDSNLT